MKKEIIDRINELGGTYSFTGRSLQSDIESISFNKSFIQKEFEDFLSNDTYDKIRETGFISEAELDCPRITFQKKLFTPFKTGTNDCDEWSSCLDKDKIRTVIKSEKLEFLFIGETGGFPNFYFICLSDQNTENPTVYSTDHEVFFDEVEVVGTLEDYFNLFVSDIEYQKTMEALVIELSSN